MRRLLVVVVTMVMVDAYGQTCKFPNEGCEADNECCSTRCVQAHPGTNPRCTKLKLYQNCLYTYQCEKPLECGGNKTCCASYWNTCHVKEDCCDISHECFETEGFYYKRCLPPAMQLSGRDPASSLTSSVTSHPGLVMAASLALPVLLDFS